MNRVKAHPPARRHNYIAKIEKLYATGAFPRGSLSEAEVIHDEWCDLLHSRGHCNCDPDIVINRRGDS